MFSPLGLGTKTCICGCDGMWYHQHVSIIACQALVVSMDDRSSLYLGGPRERREVRWVSFFFRGFEKGIMVASFWCFEGTRMMCNVFVSKNICHITLQIV